MKNLVFIMMCLSVLMIGCSGEVDLKIQNDTGFLIGYRISSSESIVSTLAIGASEIQTIQEGLINVGANIDWALQRDAGISVDEDGALVEVESGTFGKGEWTATISLIQNPPADGEPADPNQKLIKIKVEED